MWRQLVVAFVAHDVDCFDDDSRHFVSHSVNRVDRDPRKLPLLKDMDEVAPLRLPDDARTTCTTSAWSRHDVRVADLVATRSARRGCSIRHRDQVEEGLFRRDQAAPVEGDDIDSSKTHGGTRGLDGNGSQLQRPGQNSARIALPHVESLADVQASELERDLAPVRERAGKGISQCLPSLEGRRARDV